MTRTRAAALITIFGCWAVASACAKNPEAAKQEYVRSGDQYSAQKKYQEAVIQYRNALKQDPKFGEARLKLAEMYDQLGDARGALAEYVRAADLMPANVDVQLKA